MSCLDLGQFVRGQTRDPHVPHSRKPLIREGGMRRPGKELLNVGACPKVVLTNRCDNAPTGCTLPDIVEHLTEHVETRARTSRIQGINQEKSVPVS